MRTLVVVLCAAAAAVAAPIMTGGFVIEAPVIPEAGPVLPAVTDYELLENPGFETGALAPWVGSAWHITDKYPHGGTWCAFDIGNANVVQWTDTVPCSEVQSVTFWSRQPDQPAAQAYSFFYSDGTRDQYVHFPGADWTLMDVTGRLNRSRELVGFEIWGYSGGGPGPDSTYVDDVSIAIAGTGIEAAPPTGVGESPGAGIVRDVLPVRAADAPGELFDTNGRRVMALRPGANDVSRLAPGVYFARAGGWWRVTVLR
jgi:hypothetical protein